MALKAIVEGLKLVRLVLKEYLLERGEKRLERNKIVEVRGANRHPPRNALLRNS